MLPGDRSIYRDPDARLFVRDSKLRPLIARPRRAQAALAVLDAVTPEPIRERRETALSRPGYIRELLVEGSRKAQGVARQTMERVRAAVQLKY